MGDNEYIYVYIICYCYPVYHCMLSLVYMLMGRMAYCINNNKLQTSYVFIALIRKVRNCFSGLKYLSSTLTYNSSHLFLHENMICQ